MFHEVDLLPHAIHPYTGAKYSTAHSYAALFRSPSCTIQSWEKEHWGGDMDREVLQWEEGEV